MHTFRDLSDIAFKHHDHLIRAGNGYPTINENVATDIASFMTSINDLFNLGTIFENDPNLSFFLKEQSVVSLKKLFLEKDAIFHTSNHNARLLSLVSVVTKTTDHDLQSYTSYKRCESISLVVSAIETSILLTTFKENIINKYILR